MIRFNFGEMMKALQDNLEDKIEKLEEKTVAIEIKEMQIKDMTNDMNEIDVSIQMLEIMVQELLSDKEEIKMAREEEMIELEEMKKELYGDRLGQMLTKMLGGKEEA